MTVQIVMEDGHIIVTRTFESNTEQLCRGMLCNEFIYTYDCILQVSKIVSIERI